MTCFGIGENILIISPISLFYNFHFLSIACSYYYPPLPALEISVNGNMPTYDVP